MFLNQRRSARQLYCCVPSVLLFIYSVHCFISFGSEAIFAFCWNSTSARRDRLQSLSSEISFQKSLFLRKTLFCCL